MNKIDCFYWIMFIAMSAILYFIVKWNKELRAEIREILKNQGIDLRNEGCDE